MEPENLLADAAWQIKNGFIEKWPRAKILMCYYHVAVKVDERLNKEIKDESIRKSAKEDFHTLQLSQSPEVFHKASQLYLKKYEAYGNFVNYFSNEWLKKNPNWFEGASELKPSTQCAQESTHGKIKQTFTKNERVSMQEMKELSFGIVRNFSLDLLSQKPYESVPKITTKQIEDSYTWLKSYPKIMRDPDDSEESSIENWWVSENPNTVIDERKINNVKKMKWKSFDAFKTVNFGAFNIKVQKENAVKVTCTCRGFLKNFSCVHATAISINQKFINVPREVKEKYKTKRNAAIGLPNNNGRQRGRPRKAEAALIKK